MTPRPSPIRAILFDKDGTLIDYQKTWGPMNVEAARLAAGGDAALARRLLELGGMDPDTRITRGDTLLAAASNHEIAEAWVAAGSPFGVDELAARLDALFTAGAAGAVPVTDLAGLMRRLRARGLRLGIASSDSAAAIAALVARFDLGEAIDFIAGYDSGHGRKPAAGMALAFAGAVGVAPGAVAMVGDNRHDMEMGANAGCGARVAVLTGTSGAAQLRPHADVVLDSIAALEVWLDGVECAGGRA